MKRFLCLLLALCYAAAMCACGSAKPTKEEINQALQGKWNCEYSEPVVNQPSVSVPYKCSFEFNEGHVVYNSSYRLPDLSFFSEPDTDSGTYEIQDNIIHCIMGPEGKTFSLDIQYAFNSKELELKFNGHQCIKK